MYNFFRTCIQLRSVNSDLRRNISVTKFVKTKLSMDKFSDILKNNNEQVNKEEPDSTNPSYNLEPSTNDDNAASNSGEHANNKRKLSDEGYSKSTKKTKKPKGKKLKQKKDLDSYDNFNLTDYYFENGLRKVYPYSFQFLSHTKGRWVGRSILEVFSKEFRAYPIEEYERKIESGILTVNKKSVQGDYILKDNDLISNTVHRHETPVVAAKDLKIIHECDDFLVVDKPCSWPVHPCGRYRYNTVVFVLSKEYNIKNLRTIHRLDRLTSGILMFGKTAEGANNMYKLIKERIVSKEYLCRVDGDFPDENILCSEPIEVISHKLGICKVGPKGKDCETEFKKLSYNGKTSLVWCKPKTGRMHQIRVHLQYLGYPIANDPLYNNAVFGKDKGKLANYYKTDDQLVEDYINTYNVATWLGVENSKGDESAVAGSSSHPAIENQISSTNIKKEKNFVEEAYSDPMKIKDEKLPEEDKPFDISRMTYDPTCFECKMKFRDPVGKDLIMYLHALRYQGPGWKYETELPFWANDEFVED